MEKILEELWYGNICPNCMGGEAIKKAKQQMKYVENHHDKLWGTLTDKQKEMLEKYDACCAELSGISEREIFVYGFRLGARIAIEIMSFDVEE